MQFKNVYKMHNYVRAYIFCFISHANGNMHKMLFVTKHNIFLIPYKGMQISKKQHGCELYASQD